MPTVPGGRASEQPVDALLGAVQAPLGPSQGRVTELRPTDGRAPQSALESHTEDGGGEAADAHSPSRDQDLCALMQEHCR